MQLTKHTDFGLRSLIYLALHPKRRVSTAEIAGVFGIPSNHLTKVIRRLATAGIVHTYRGKGGGSALAMPPAAIRIGNVVRQLEGRRDMINCERPLCPAISVCGVRDVMHEAQMAFLAVLDGCTLHDVMRDRSQALNTLLTTPSGRDEDRAHEACHRA